MNTIDPRAVERYSGQPDDFDAWHTRFQVDAYTLNYLDILEGTERVGHGAIMTQIDINAIGEANARAAEQAILDDHIKRNRGAFMFLLKALDNGTMMTVKNAVAGDALPARAAYVEMLRVLRDVSNISIMRQIIELLEMQATGVDDAKETIRQQFLRYRGVVDPLAVLLHPRVGGIPIGDTASGANIAGLPPNLHLAGGGGPVGG